MANSPVTLEQIRDRLDAIAAEIAAIRAALDPVALSMLTAPPDDEPITEDQVRRVLEAEARMDRGESIPHEEVLKEFGL